MNKKYCVKYLPLFQHDLMEITNYISHILQNHDAAVRLVDEVEIAILNRAKSPSGYEPYQSSKQREHKYYRIYVKNYTIFYVLIDDTMEIRRILYNKRNFSQLL